MRRRRGSRGLRPSPPPGTPGWLATAAAAQRHNYARRTKAAWGLKFRPLGVGLAVAPASEVTDLTAAANAMPKSKYAKSYSEPTLWKKLGFAIVGTLPRAFRHASLGDVDAYVMHRFL